MSIIEVSSVHETHKHASLNDSGLSVLIQKGRVSVAFVPIEISIISQGGEKKKRFAVKASWLPSDKRMGFDSEPQRGTSMA